MNRTYKSLKRQILFRLFLIITLAFLLVEGMILERSYRALNEALENALQARVESLVMLTEVEAEGKIDFEFVGEVMQDFRGPDPRAYFLIRRLSDNKEIERSESLKSGKLQLPIPVQEIKPQSPYFWNARIEDKRVCCLALREYPLLDDDLIPEKMSEQEGAFTARRKSLTDLQKSNELLFLVALDRSETDRQFWTILKQTSATLGVGLIFLLLSGWFIVARSLRPLRELEKEVRHISAENLQPVTVPFTQEIAHVAQALNRLLKHLKEAFERERRFTADVAHELRTPIAEMRSLAEVALKWPEGLSDRERKNLEDILASAKQIQKIVTTLLILARCDSGALTCQKEQVHLEELINSTWHQFENKAVAKQIAVKRNVPSDMAIVTDRELFQTILANLFANAVEYTEPQGKIEWNVSIKNGEFLFSLSNTTQELTEEDLPHLFERFWQKEKARSHAEAHSGLGLALVHAVATVLGFSVKAHLTNHNLFTITLSGRLRHSV